MKHRIMGRNFVYNNKITPYNDKMTLYNDHKQRHIFQL